MSILKFFLLSNLIIFFINQMQYNFCIKYKCLAAGIPKVIVFSLIATTIYYIIKSENKKDDNNNK